MEPNTAVPMPAAPITPVAPVVPVSSPVPALEVKKKSGIPMRFIILGCGALIAIIAIIAGVVLYLMNPPKATPNDSQTPTSQTPTSTPPAEVKHGWTASYAVYPTSTSKPDTYVFSSEKAAPQKVTYTGITGVITVQQMLSSDLLLVTACADGSGASCGLYEYTISTSTPKTLIEGVSGIMAGRKLNADTYVYLSNYSQLTLNMLKAGVNKVLNKAEDTVGRGGSFYDMRSILVTADSSYFVLVDTVGGITDYTKPPVNYAYRVYSADGTESDKFCTLVSGPTCESPVISGDSMLYRKIVSGSTEYHKYTFSTKADAVVASKFDIQPQLSPNGTSIVSWSYDYNETPGLSLNYLTVAGGTVTTLDKPYNGPVWLDDNQLVVQTNKAPSDVGMFNFTYGGLIVINKVGDQQQVLEDGTASSAGSVQVYRY